MDNSIIEEIATLGYKEKVGDIFINWENVKDEILEPERKTGTGNGTIHVFLGKEGYRLFQNEFPEYYEQVKSTNETADHAPRIRHIFSKANLISSIGHVCNYYIQKNEAEKVLDLVTKVATKLNESSDKFFFAESLFKWSTGSSDLRPYFKQFDEGFSKTVRSLLLPNSAYKISLFKNENNEYAAFWLIGFNGLTDFEVESSASYLHKESDQCICRAKKLTDFILKCVEYFKELDNLDSISPYAADVSINSPIKVSKDGDFSLVGMFLETDIDEVKKRNEQHSRWFENSFSLGDRTVYLSTQWNASGDYQLTLSDFEKLIKTCYGVNYYYKLGQSGEHELWKKDSAQNTTNNQTFPLQRIFYGAPGTGKSHGIKGQEILFSKVIRTTFHPDSDYSTFVGAYKPTMEESEVKVTPVVINNGISLDQNNGTYKEKRITYTFVKQAFLKAYIEAWNRHDKGENVLLVIEEINRGNCAQIFGDLFQLLDRNDEGYSDYPIQADEDIRMVLADEFVNLDNIPENVKSGEELLLPNNLYIWATMNTSDQSLFPIDSAFKRRWDWEYMKIKNENKNWKIDIKQGEENVDWWEFVQKINTIIASMTSSADKQLGYFFCKADKKANGADAEPTIISAKAFVGKVLFYLWNDVFKDTGFEDESLFTYEEAGKKTELTFPDFYGEDGKDVDTKRVADFINRVMAWQKQEENL